MKIPYVNFKTRQGDTNAVGGCTFIGGDWKEVDTTEIFDAKKVLEKSELTALWLNNHLIEK